VEVAEIAAQDDAREKKLRDLFNLRVEPDRKRHDTDAYLDLDGIPPIPFELKSTTGSSISTVRDFNPDHVAKWRDKHWIFGFFDKAGEEPQWCCYASPAVMRPWIEKLERYVRPDFLLAESLPDNVNEEMLIEAVGDKEVYSPEDARAILKKQWKKAQYDEALDFHDGYTRARMLELLPEGLAEAALIERVGDKDIYSHEDAQLICGRRPMIQGRRWKKADFLAAMDVHNGYSKATMVRILRIRAEYVIRRGATLNNPHISKKFFAGFDKITSRHATRLVQLVQEAMDQEAEGIEPAEAEAMREAAKNPVFVGSQDSADATDEATA
jgi:hypothetical protein